MITLDKKRTEVNTIINSLLASHKDINAIICYGSFGREDYNVFSDIDAYVLTDNPKKYLVWNDTSWAKPLGNPISFRILDQYQKLKLITDNGIFIDLTIVSIKKFKLLDYYIKLNQTGLKWIFPKKLQNKIEGNIENFGGIVKRGFKIYGNENFDITKLKSSIQKAVKFISDKPKKTYGEKDFWLSYNTFWQTCYAVSLKLISNEFYYSIVVYDSVIKRELIKMIEKEALIRNPLKDVYYDGYRMNSWGDKDIVEALPETLMQQTPLDMQKSLIKTAQLYKKVTKTVAEKYGFKTTPAFEDFVQDFITNIAIPETESQYTLFH